MSLPTRLRTFVAIELSPALRRRVAAVRDAVVEGLPGVRPVADANLHLTLKFLGEIDRDDLAEATAIVEAAAAAVPAPGAPLPVGGLGVFPPGGRPRVVWVGVEDEAGTLGALHRELDRGLRRVGVKRDGPGRFTPHVTIARVRDRAGAFGLRRRLEEVSAAPRGGDLGELDAGELTFFLSEAHRDGATYSPLARIPVGPPA